MAEQKETVVLTFDVDEGDSIETINSLTKANKELRAERNALNLQSKEGQKRAHEINSLLDQNTNKIKTNVSALEKQKINIGNYKSALDGVHPALGKVATGLDKGASGFMAMAKSALAFIATPIGAILAALVAVFTLLKTALSQNDALMDKFENVTNAVGVVVEVVTARIGKLGEALIKLASGDFTGAIDSAAEAFSGLGDEIANAVRQQQLFLDASRDLEDDTRALNIQIARTENELKRLDKASKNVNLTFAEQEELVLKAAALQEQLVKAKEDIARRDLLTTARRLRADKEFQQQSNETFDQYIQRLLNSSALAPEELDKIAEKVIALENARGSSLDDQAKRENALAVIQGKRAEELKKQNEELRIQAERQATIDAVNKRSAERVDDPVNNPFDSQVKIETDLTKLMKDQLDQRAKDSDEYWDERNEQAKKAAQLAELTEDRKLGAAAAVTGGIKGLLDEQGEAYKVAASAQVLISTYSAATKAYEAAFLPIPTVASPAIGAAFAAAAVLQGLANLATIHGVQFAEGGWTGVGSKMDVAGLVHKDEYVTPKWQVHSAAAQPHLQALERQRLTGYADGGFVTGSLSGPVINQQLLASNIIKNMPPIIASWEEGRRVGRRLEMKEKISKR